jgi:fructose 1,6-bisphosphatase
LSNNDAFAKIDSKTLTSLEAKTKKALANILTYRGDIWKAGTATDVVAALKKGNGSVELKGLNVKCYQLCKKMIVVERHKMVIIRKSLLTDVISSNARHLCTGSVVMPK